MDDGVMVLLSGGIDSTVCAALAQSQGRLKACISFNYGQRAASAECGLAKRWATTRNIPWLGVMLPHNMELGRALSTGVGTVGPRVVPARNAIFASCAASHAVTMQCPVIWYGATADDAADYPDCRAAWIEAMSEVLHLAAGVRLEAPLVDKTKREVVALGNTLGIDWERDTFSCYQPRNGIVPCGTCNACVSRQVALGGLVDDAVAEEDRA